MNAVRTAVAEIVGLFIEDRAFSLALALWLVANFVAARLGIVGVEQRGPVLAAGLAVLAVGGAVAAARIGKA